MRYRNFDLWIEARAGEVYPLRATSDRGGEARGTADLDPACPELEGMIAELDACRGDPARLRETGTWLFDRVFDRQIRDVLQRAYMDACGRPETGLRVRLRVEPPEMAFLPWEALWFPTEESFFSRLIRFPLVRYEELDRPLRSLEAQLPVRILAAIPDAVWPNPELAAEREKASLLEAIEGLGDRVAVDFIQGTVTTTRVSDALRERNYHVLHFIGHGTFDGDRGRVLLNTEEGGEEPVDDERFAGLFLNHDSLKLVVLNSCQGAATSATKPLAGVAPLLVRRGVPAVLAMRFPVRDKAAVRFAREFYRSLFRSKDQGRVEVAVSHARNRLATEFPEHADLATPVLFLRTHGGALFNLTTGSRVRDVLREPASLDTLDAVRETYEKSAPEAAADEVRRHQGRVRLRRGAVLVALVALVVALLGSGNVLDFLTLDTRLERLTLWLGGVLVPKSPDDRIRIVAVEEGSRNDAGQEFGWRWRGDIAELVTKLAGAGDGARVVAFDMWFEPPDPSEPGFDPALADDYRKALADAFRGARKKGTAVVVGYQDLDGTAPRGEREILHAASATGHLLLGARQGHTYLTPLVARLHDDEILPALALRAAAAFECGERTEPADLDAPDRWVSFTREGRSAERFAFTRMAVFTQGSPWTQKVELHDPHPELAFDTSPMEAWTHAGVRHRYREVLREMDAAALRDAFEGRVVLVGVEDERDVSPVVRGWRREKWYRLYLHAEILDSLLRGRPIRSLGWFGQLLATLLLALAGVLSPGWAKRLDLGRYGRVSFTAGIVVAWLGLALSVYTRTGILIDALYPLGAFFLGRWAAGKVVYR